MSQDELDKTYNEIQHTWMYLLYWLKHHSAFEKKKKKKKNKRPSVVVTERKEEEEDEASTPIRVPRYFWDPDIHW
jgi:hypothetical protein